MHMIIPITDAFNLTYVSINCRRRKTLEHGLYAKSNIQRKASKLRHSLKVESIVMLSVHLLLMISPCWLTITALSSKLRPRGAGERGRRKLSCLTMKRAERKCERQKRQQ